MNEQTLIYNLHYLLGRPATQALIASPARWNVAYTPDLVQDDNLPIRLRFYELDPETNEPTLTRYPAGTLFALTGKQKGALETGDTLFTCLEFTETEVIEDIEGTPTLTDLYYAGTLNLNTVPLDAAFALNEIITALVDLKVYTEDPDQSQTVAQSPFRLLHQAHDDSPPPEEVEIWGSPATYLRYDPTTGNVTAGGLNNTREGAGHIGTGLFAGENNQITGPFAHHSIISGGLNNQITGSAADLSYIAAGGNNEITGANARHCAILAGHGNQIPGPTAEGTAILAGHDAKARLSSVVRGACKFSAPGDAQDATYLLKYDASDGGGTNTLLVETILGSGNSSITVPTDIQMHCLAHILLSNGADCSKFTREFIVKNVGGTVSLEGTVQTIGTDITAAGGSVAITADNTGKTIQIAATGQGRWLARVQALEIAGHIV